jgi:hypothetical protein
MAVTAFKTARSLIGISDFGGTYDAGGRITPAIQIGDSVDVSTQFATMITAMKTQIVTQLGLTGTEQSKAEKMAEALIIQLGQDNEEFRAFIDDLGAKGTFSTALSHDYSTGAETVSSVGSQSDIKLAAVNPETTFDPEELKGNKVYEKYTGYGQGGDENYRYS